MKYLRAALLTAIKLLTSAALYIFIPCNHSVEITKLLHFFTTVSFHFILSFVHTFSCLFSSSGYSSYHTAVQVCV